MITRVSLVKCTVFKLHLQNELFVDKFKLQNINGHTNSRGSRAK